jgi:hypothetical protein
VTSRIQTLRSMPGVRVAAAVSLSASLASSAAHSQYIATGRIAVDLRSAAIAGPAIGGGDTAQRNHPHPLPARAFTAGLGWIGGAIVGAYVWYQIRPHDCSCDDPGLEQIIEGGFGGGALGAAFGAAAPELDSRCSFKTRIARGLLGSLAGTAIGLLAGSDGGNSVERYNAAAIAVPVLSVSGATLAVWRC